MSPSIPTPGTVLVVDDDAAVREALTSLIRSAGLPVQTFATAQAFLAHGRPETPACLVLDVRLPGLDGLELQGEMARRHLELPIIFITGHGDVRTSVKAMKAGAVDFLTKPFRDRELLAAIISGLARDAEAAALRREEEALRRRFASLSEREREVIALAAKGYMNKQIAAKLGTAEITVKVQRGRAMKKMNAASFADLVRMLEQLSRK